MADNTTLNTGSGGDTVATDDIGGIKFPRSKIVIGADGVNDGDVSAANPLPVTGTLTAVTSITNTVTVDGSGVTQPVSGTVTANLSATDNALLDAIAASLVDVETNTNSGAVVGGGLEATALRVTIASDSTGVVTVDDGGSSLTVDGTIAATQSGTWTVELGATDNAVLDAIAASLAGTLTVDGSGVTQPVSDGGGSLTVDGTVAATQSGTWNVGTLTTLTGGAVASGATDSGNPHKIGGVYNTTAPTFTDGQRGDVQISSRGAIHVTTGVGGVQLAAGSAAIGKLAANSGVDIGDVDVTSIAAGTNLIGDVGLRPRTSGGLTMHKTTSAATTNATSVKASAGQVYGIQCFNVNAAVRYLKLYNKASAPTVGTDTPVKTLAIPGNTAGAGFVVGWPVGLAFSTGIAFALTTEATDAGTTAVAANEITVNIDYN